MDSNLTNYFGLLPNEIVVVILEMLPFAQIIDFTRVNGKYRQIIKGTVWNSSNVSFRYLLKNYRFTSCTVNIGLLNEMLNDRKEITFEEYNTLCKNLEICDTAELYWDSNNDISAGIFKSLRNVTKFVGKNICDDYFYYHGIGRCDRITKAVFNDCCISDSIVEKMVNVVKLQITNSRSVRSSRKDQLHQTHKATITGSGFANLTKLRTLKLVNCANITDHAFTHLGNVNKIHIERCEKTTYNALSYLANVIEMYSDIPIRKSNLAKLFQLTKLEILYLLNNYFIPSKLAAMSNLKELHLRYSRFCRLGPEHVAKLEDAGIELFEDIALPNDTITEILQYFPFDELVRFNQLNHRYKQLVKTTHWHNYTIDNAKYMITGYTVGECNLDDRWPRLCKRINGGYKQTLRAISKTKSVVINSTCITPKIIRALSSLPAKRVLLTNCNFGTVNNGAYKLINNIQSLTLYNCKNFRATLSYLCNANKLCIINKIRNTKINRTMQKYLSEPNVMYFESINVIIDDGLSMLEGIDSLSLEYCNSITDRGLWYLRNASTVRLHLCNTITGRGLSHLVNVKRLYLLCLAGITGDELKYLANRKWLHIIFKTLQDEELRDLGNIENLTLYVFNGVSDDGLKYLANVKTLSLTLGAITNEGLRNLSNVEDLTINGCPYIDDIGLKYLSSVKKIKLSYTSAFTDDGFSYLSKMDEVRLENFSGITGDGLRHLSSIDTVYLYNVDNINDDHLRHLANCKRLHIGSCKNITNDGLKHLVGIEVLKIYECNGITPDCLQILANVPNLIISECNGVRNPKKISCTDKDSLPGWFA